MPLRTAREKMRSTQSDFPALRYFAKFRYTASDARGVSGSGMCS
jgi:hypothetical protein